MTQRYQHRAECSYCGKPGHSYDQGHTRQEEHRKTKCDCCRRAGHRYELCHARQAEYHIKGTSVITERGSATATNSVAPGRLSTTTTELNVSTTKRLGHGQEQCRTRAADTRQERILRVRVNKQADQTTGLILSITDTPAGADPPQQQTQQI